MAGEEIKDLEYFFFREWKITRGSTISQLRKLAKKIQRSENNHTKGQIVYSSAGIVSGGLAVAGILTAPFTAGLSLALTTGSSAFGATSGVLGLTHSAINYNNISSKCRDAKDILEKDKKLTEKLMKYINVTIIKMEEVGTYADTLKTVVFSLNTVRSNVSNIRSATQTARAFNAVRAKNLDEAAKLLNMGKYTQKILPNSIKKNVVLLVDDVGTVKFAEAAGRIGGKAATGRRASRTFVQMSAKVALPIAVIGTVMDVWSLINNAEKIHSGELSAHAKRLIKIADDLEKQMRDFEEEILNLLHESENVYHRTNRPMVFA